MNTTYTFKCFNITFRFCIPEPKNKKYFMYLYLKKDEVSYNYDNVEVTKTSNDVYRSKDIIFEEPFIYDTYLVKSIKIMLKIRNNTISPVSTLLATCYSTSSSKKRIFAFTLEDMEEYGDLTQG